MRYIALIDERSTSGETASRLASHLGAWPCHVVKAAGAQLQVWCDDPSEVTWLDERDGLILGTLFRTGRGPVRPAALSTAQSLAIIETNGQELMTAYWGSYVAFLSERRGRGAQVVRAPMGALGCYHAHLGPALVVTNDVGSLVLAGIVDGAIDWGGVAAHIAAPSVRPERTAIEAVRELTGGERLGLFKGEVTRTTLWSPWGIVRGQGDRAPDGAAAALKGTIDAVVSAWAKTVGKPLLGLSGGLDSSIVAAALAEAGTEFCAMTLVSSDASGDERRYARAVARHLGRPLYEEARRVEGVDLSRSHARHLPRPLARSFSQESDRAHQAIAARCGAQAYFSGGGGDNVFGYQASVAPLVDRLRRQGLGAGARQTALDLGLMANVSQPVVWRKALGRLLSRRIFYRAAISTEHLAPDLARAAGARASHPWLSPPPDALPGAAGQVALLHLALNYLEGFDRERTAPSIAPLMSQPVVEHCLSFPSWCWFRGGANRAIARDAYRAALPEAIIDRPSKATPDSFVVEIFEKNFDLIKAMILDGALAREKVIDRRRVEQALAASRVPRGPGFWQLMALADVEAWLIAWSARRAGRAATSTLTI